MSATGASVLRAAPEWTEERLLRLNYDLLFRLWSESRAAEMTDLVGEFRGLVPNEGDPERGERTAQMMFDEHSPVGYWLGKAFTPLGKQKGDGYNIWRRPDGTVERNLRFATEMGRSIIDGQPALLMIYAAYQNPYLPAGKVNTLVDEIRRLDDGVYIGMGTRSAPGGRTAPGHFVLLGPTARCAGVDDPATELL